MDSPLKRLALEVDLDREDRERRGDLGIAEGTPDFFIIVRKLRDESRPVHRNGQQQLIK
jgi:hypothetical protein